MTNFSNIAQLLEQKYLTFDQPFFIEKDPISIPHRFSIKQDIEIAAFFAAILAWGNRTSIINSCNRLLGFMDQAPYEFLIHHQEADLKPMMNFVHRTFNATDLYYFIEFLSFHYKAHESLEAAFLIGYQPSDLTIENSLKSFHEYFFSLPDAPQRTRKHIATPARKSACKRLNMFLRWMVRKDEYGVDFGIWNTIQTHQLICPLDTHVGDVGRRLGLIERKPNDWQAALELTTNLKEFDPNDPVKYDYALFGLGILEKF